MGMTIDECIEIWKHPTRYFPSKREEAIYFAKDTMRKYQQLQADYENRLKADLVAMLTEIQLEIEEKDKETTLDDYDCGYNTGIYVSSEIIQQKINSLKEVKDGLHT